MHQPLATLVVWQGIVAARTNRIAVNGRRHGYRLRRSWVTAGA